MEGNGGTKNREVICKLDEKQKNSKRQKKDGKLGKKEEKILGKCAEKYYLKNRESRTQRGECVKRIQESKEKHNNRGGGKEKCMRNKRGRSKKLRTLKKRPSAQGTQIWQSEKKLHDWGEES